MKRTPAVEARAADAMAGMAGQDLTARDAPAVRCLVIPSWPIERESAKKLGKA